MNITHSCYIFACALTSTISRFRLRKYYGRAVSIEQDKMKETVFSNSKTQLTERSSVATELWTKSQFCIHFQTLLKG